MIGMVGKGFPRSQKRYPKMAVLMCHREHDDIGVSPLETELVN